MKISEFLSDLSIMDDDFKKVMKLENFISSLENELKRIVDSPHQFIFSVHFLNEAIARFKEQKRVSEVQAVSKGCKSNLEKNARTQHIPVINLESDDEGELNNVSNGLINNFQPHQNGNAGMNLGQKHPEPSIHGGTHVSWALMMQSEPREKRVRNIFGIQEPPVKRMRIWSDDLHMKFVHAMDTLGGPLAATPKKIKDLMQVADITEDEIKILLLKYRPTQYYNTCSMVDQDVIKVSRSIIQSGSQHIGEFSNGQVAAASEKTGGGWKVVCRVDDLWASMREMLIGSGSLEMPESSSRQMAAANEANGGWKLVSGPYINANGPVNNHK